MPLSFKASESATGSGTAGVRVDWGWVLAVTNSIFAGDDVAWGGVAEITWHFCAGVGVTWSLADTGGGVDFLTEGVAIVWVAETRVT